MSWVTCERCGREYDDEEEGDVIDDMDVCDDCAEELLEEDLFSEAA